MRRRGHKKGQSPTVAAAFAGRWCQNAKGNWTRTSRGLKLVVFRRPDGLWGYLRAQLVGDATYFHPHPFPTADEAKAEATFMTHSSTSRAHRVISP